MIEEETTERVDSRSEHDRATELMEWWADGTLYEKTGRRYIAIGLCRWCGGNTLDGKDHCSEECYP